MEKKEIVHRLRESGSRATPARVDVLTFLSTQRRPIGIETIQNKFPRVNKATLYRMMSDFTERGLVHVSDLGHGHVDYEFADRPHHHHIVCAQCGMVEDVYACKPNAECTFEEVVLDASKEFAQIQDQQTVFFGTCKRCARKK